MRRPVSPCRASVAAAFLIATVAFSGAAFGQFNLTTIFASNNGQAGNMFDVVVTGANPVTLTSFDVNIDAVGPFDIEIWAVTGGGTIVGVNGTPAAWTLEATAMGVVSNGTDTPTPLGANLTSIVIPSGGIQGIYVNIVANLSGGVTTAINYTNGSGFGTPIASDANIDIHEGFGSVGNFGGSFGDPATGSSRVWNGTIHYDGFFVAGNGQAPQPGAAVLDINDAAEANGFLVPSGQNGPYSSSVAADGSLNMTISGTPLQSIVLLGGALNVGVLLAGPPGQLDIGGAGFAGLQIIADGTSTTFPDAFFATNAAGFFAFNVTVPALPPGVITTFQALVFGSPSIISFSNAIELSAM